MPKAELSLDTFIVISDYQIYKEEMFHTSYKNKLAAEVRYKARISNINGIKIQDMTGTTTASAVTSTWAKCYYYST